MTRAESGSRDGMRQSSPECISGVCGILMCMTEYDEPYVRHPTYDMTVLRWDGDIYPVLKPYIYLLTVSTSGDALAVRWQHRKKSTTQELLINKRFGNGITYADVAAKLIGSFQECVA